MSKKVRELQSKKATLVKDARSITDIAAADGRDMTADEQTKFDGLMAQINAANAAIDREQLLAAEETALGYEPAGSVILNASDNRADDPKRGFRSFGDFAKIVKASSTPGVAPDQRLMIGAAAPGVYGNESSGADGGFAVPPDFANSIWLQSLGEDSLLPMTDNTPVSGNSMVFPKDETTPWGTDGIRAYWQAEASLANATKPKLGTQILRLYKLMALVPVTDELLQDTNALNGYLPTKVGQSIMWKTNEAILFGTGNGTPLGAFLGSAVVTIAKEAGQATQTLQALNLAKMIARLPAGSFPRAVWIVNNDVLPALFTLTLGNYPIYLPGGTAVGGVQINPYGTLLGRPIMISQHAKSFSSQGDILLADPQYIRSITSQAGMQTASSMHLYFDADATAFRTTFRVDAQPKIVNPIAPFNGAANLSPFVQLGVR